MYRSQQKYTSSIKNQDNMFPHIGKNPANLIVIISGANSKMTNGSFCKIDHILKLKENPN